MPGIVSVPCSSSVCSAACTTGTRVVSAVFSRSRRNGYLYTFVSFTGSNCLLFTVETVSVGLEPVPVYFRCQSRRCMGETFDRSCSPCALFLLFFLLRWLATLPQADSARPAAVCFSCCLRLLFCFVFSRCLRGALDVRHPIVSSNHSVILAPLARASLTPPVAARPELARAAPTSFYPAP